ncbi:MAG: Na/Pi cotransporter family protein [Lachnospiraceae bacterium]|nr:Na/Pi cotransporter family protein [Lachnospiraceae bacterium]
MNVFSVISLLGGLAMFLYGMKLMGNNLKESSSGTLKIVIGKMTDNTVKALFLGVIITAMIQSSTATIVITSGLVAAGVLSFDQSFGIIVGANIGTTVTGQIIRLMDINAESGSFLQFFQPSTLAPLALIIGIILIMGFKFKRADNFGNIAIGFGILFTGLMNMTSAVSAFAESGIIDVLFENMGNNPFLSYFTGALISFVLQSSSATIGMLQAFSQAGTIPFKVVYVVIVGVYLGDCLTTGIVCAIGAKADSKRVGLLNIIYNLFKTVLVLVVVTLLKNFGVIDGLWDMTMRSGSIADANTIFNAVCALLLLPAGGILKKVTRKLIKDDKVASGKYADKVSALNPVFFRTPAIAFGGCYDVLTIMFDAATANIKKAFDVIYRYDEKTIEEIHEEEENIDYLTDCVDKYLIQLAPYVSEDLHLRILKQYHKLVSEFEHLGDYADKMADSATTIHEEGIVLSKTALNEIGLTRTLVEEIITYSSKAFEKRNISAAYHIEPSVDVLHDIVATLHDNHLVRLREGLCTVRGGVVFSDILTNVERIGKTCSNIGIATIARVSTEVENSKHSYTASIHQGKNEEYNMEYERTHEVYYGRLAAIDKEEPAAEVKDV